MFWRVLWAGSLTGTGQGRTACTLHRSQRSDLGFWDPHQCKVWKLLGGSEEKCGCLKKSLWPGGTWSLSSNISKAQQKRPFAVLDTWAPTAKTGINWSFTGRDFTFERASRWRDEDRRDKVIRNQRLRRHSGVSSLWAKSAVSLWPAASALSAEFRAQRCPASPVCSLSSAATDKNESSNLLLTFSAAPR